MDTLKEKLGDSFGCDVAETEDNIAVIGDWIWGKWKAGHL